MRIINWFFKKDDKNDQTESGGAQGSETSRSIEVTRGKTLSPEIRVTTTDVSGKIKELEETLGKLKAAGIPLPVGAEALVKEKPGNTKDYKSLAALDQKVEACRKEAGVSEIQLKARKAAEGVRGCVLCCDVSPTVDYSRDLRALFGVSSPRISSPLPVMG